MTKPALNSVDTHFDALLQDLPVDLVAAAREFHAFTRARKLKTPQELRRVVLLYGGLDQSLRTVAGNLTLLEERLTDSSVRARLTACEPWVKALLPQLLPPPAGTASRVSDLGDRWLEWGSTGVGWPRLSAAPATRAGELTRSRTGGN